MDFKAIYTERLSKDKTLFYIDKEVVCTQGTSRIMKRASYYGLQCESTDLLPTIFDSISYVSGSIVKVIIDSLIGLFSIDKKDWIFEPDIYKLEYLQDFQTVEVSGEKGLGLFSILENRMVIPPAYDETTRSAGGEFLWVREGGRFNFVQKDTQIFYSASDAQMVYDTDTGMWVRHSDGRVALLNSAGNDDIDTFRKILIKNKGRMTLQNIKYNIVHICDIYGQILN